MRNLLFVCHRIPYPPNKGDKIRSWNFLRHLAKEYRVHLAAFYDDPEDARYAAKLREVCASVHLEYLSPRAARLACTRGFWAGEALSFPYYRSQKMREWVRAAARQHPIDVAFAFSSQMAPYILDPAIAAGAKVCDFVDVDSEKWRQYADTKPFPLSCIYEREARLLAAAERSLAERLDASIFVSPAEADVFQRRAGEAGGRIFAIGNGVDAVWFDPAHSLANPYRGDKGPVIVFSGAMDYWPNVDAVEWFARAIFPAVRQAQPTARFVVCGARPTKPVEALAALPGITVTGTVNDIRGYIRHADVSVAPMRVARGIQNKVLEAMALGRPAVTTPFGLEGIDADAQREVVVADGADAFAAATCSLLASAERRRAIGQAARDRIERDFTWDVRLSQLSRLLDSLQAVSPATMAA